MDARGGKTIALSCIRFQRWLDDGMPGDAEPRARAHAASCAACAARLRPALEIDRALMETGAAAPAAFEERVMARVAATPQRGTAPLMLPPASLPWWTLAAAEPACALALGLAALLVWRFEAAWSAAAAIGGVATLGVAWTEARLGAFGSALDPAARLGLWLGLLPLFILSALALFRWFEASTRLAAIRGRGTRR